MIHTTEVAKRIHRARSRADGDATVACNERIDLGSNLLLPYPCSPDSFVVFYHQYLRNGLPKCKHTGGRTDWIVHQ